MTPLLVKDPMEQRGV